MKFVAMVFFACALTCVACTSVHSNMTINGKPFGPDSCRNLGDEELYGVDLSDDSGTVLRIVKNDDDSIDVIVFYDDIKPQAMTGCSTVYLDRSSNDKTGHYSLSGSAQISCSGTIFNVQGTTDFNDCDHDF